MTPPNIPVATYRLQFNPDFTFADADNIIPYLHLLGISHVYASPLLKARAGSPHGYNIVDHNALNPEIGGEEEFIHYVGTLREHGMGQILDIVPNHMGVGGDDNNWWLDVLENGEASTYAGYFDIDWHPVNPVLHNKVLLPFLGDHYGTILEQGELNLGFDHDNGILSVRYHEHCFPIDPRTYPQILSFRIEMLEHQLGHNPEAFDAFRSLIADFRSLPRRTELSTSHRQQRHNGITTCRQRLSELCHTQPEILAFIHDNVTYFNGTAGQAASFDRLHHLLEAQAYRLAYWQVASDEINYRRFFDINELAGIRMENREVFAATHHFIQQLITSGRVDGVRIDHPDGLSDPFGYYCDLQHLISEVPADTGQLPDQPFYLLVEKILASYEHLPGDWPVAGTTGYDTALLLNGLFICPDGGRSLTRLYSHFTGHDVDFDELLYECKKLIIRTTLSSELTVLANLISGIAQADRNSRDFTYHGLRKALSEVVACFPVYRTYITAERINDEDRRYVQWAITRAKKRSLASDILIYDFIHDLLVLSHLDEYDSNVRRRVIQFALRFQQYTAPVMAKGMEDTAFYIDNRLVSLNDVGFDPRSFGISVNAFHHENRRRLDDWPHTMVTTSTHDSKRSEDVRARINVLSEVAGIWRKHLSRWSRINRHKKRLINHERAPTRNDEYLLYQTLVGVWPLLPPDTIDFAGFRERIEAYMLKAIKEAKLHTSWINPNQEYEEVMRHFVSVLLDDPEHSAFLADFIPFQSHISRCGLFNSLSQTLLKLTIPGVPDIYQGNELWAFNLVDPDNRQPVDYEQRRSLLQALVNRIDAGDDLSGLSRELLEQINDGRAKLYLTWKTLELRRRHLQLFSDGEYVSLAAMGSRSDHICAFARNLDDKQVIVIATRWFVRLLTGDNSLPLGQAIWEDTLIEAPGNGETKNYRNILTNEHVSSVQLDDKLYFHAADLLRNFSVALLINE